MVIQEDTEIYPGSGKRRPYVQRGREICIILHLSACTRVNTGGCGMCVLLRMSVVLLGAVSSVLFLSPSFYSSKERPRVHV